MNGVLGPGWGGTLVKSAKLATDGHLALLLEAVYPWARPVATSLYPQTGPELDFMEWCGPWDPRPFIPEDAAWEVWEKNLANLPHARMLAVLGIHEHAGALLFAHPGHTTQIWCNPYKYTVAFGMVRFDCVKQGDDPLSPLYLWDEMVGRVNGILMPIRPFDGAVAPTSPERTAP